MKTKEKSNNILSIVACCLFANLSYSQQTYNDCAEQFSENAIALDAYNISQVAACTPFFGDNNSAGFSDAQTFFGFVGALLSGSLYVSGGSAITITTGMLDQLNNYWDCVGETEQSYNQALDLLGSSFDDCWKNVTEADYN